MREKLTADIVRSEVDRFWKTFQAKDADALMQFYSPAATVFGSTSPRPEPGRLASARRQREYFHPKTVLKVRVSNLDVLLLGDYCAVCGYSFDFDATHVATGIGGDLHEHFEQGRVTQVFAYDEEDRLRVVHEHISVAHK
jgi:ketosteroid isomerase-like protein